MEKETREALESIIKGTTTLLSEKYGHRKRLKQSELWEKATLYRDLVVITKWLADNTPASCINDMARAIGQEV